MDEKFTITHKELNSFFTSVKEELIVAIENKLESKIESKVNGRIKGIAETLKEHGAVLDDINKKIQPILESRRDNEGFKKTSYALLKVLLGLSSVIGAWYVIKDFILK